MERRRKGRRGEEGGQKEESRLEESTVEKMRGQESGGEKWIEEQVGDRSREGE